MTRIGDWMQTYTGGAYWPLDPRVDDVRIEDIAHALAHINRFGGHTSRFYSVAEHSLHVSYLVPLEHALTGLMHDATEAYLGDVIRPLKKYLTNYRELEQKNWEVIARKYDLPLILPSQVHTADNAMCVIETRALMGESPNPSDDWRVNAIVPANVVLMCYHPEAAMRAFMRRFEQLC